MRGLALVAAPGCAPTLLCSVAPQSVHCLAVLLTMAALLFLVGLQPLETTFCRLWFGLPVPHPVIIKMNRPPACYCTPPIGRELLCNLWWRMAKLNLLRITLFHGILINDRA